VNVELAWYGNFRVRNQWDGGASGTPNCCREHDMVVKVQKIEEGTVNTTLRTLELLSRGFSVDVVELLKL
jgi:hypothetical protein